MESSHNPFPWCGECGTWHAPDGPHVSIAERDAFAFSAEISRLTLALAAETTRANLYASKLEPFRWRALADEMPPDRKSVLLLFPGGLVHSGTRAFEDAYNEHRWFCAAIKQHGMMPTHWMPRPEEPK